MLHLRVQFFRLRCLENRGNSKVLGSAGGVFSGQVWTRATSATLQLREDPAMSGGSFQTPRKGRSDFTKAVKRRVAERAAYRCSMPKCRRLTIGPGFSDSESATCGVAAHIYSAADGGPRGVGGLSERERTSLSNAIWLCETHAKLVDANRGDSFPAEVLLGYKELHEHLIRTELLDLAVPYSWIREVEVLSSSLFVPNTRLVLGRLTLFTGPNNSGKSSLCEWIAGAASAESVGRWKTSFPSNAVTEVVIRCNRPEPVEMRLRMLPNGMSDFSIDGRPYPTNPLRINVLRVNRSTMIESASLDDIADIAHQLGEPDGAVEKLVPRIVEYGTGWLRVAHIEMSGTTRRLVARTKVSDWDLGYRQQGGAERVRTVIEFAIVLAKMTARYSPVLLVLDEMLENLDQRSLAQLVADLAEFCGELQVIVVLPSGREEGALANWQGWVRAAIERTPEGSRIV